ncbi:MAG: OmpA family protein [Desulfobacca sp.]|nr:OmpA family protein [Desulfobacca sp.]
MNLLKIFYSGLFFLFLFSAGCSLPGKNVFVLLPDPDGKTGKILVSNPSGSQLLAHPKEATEIAKPGEAPSTPFIMEEKQIRDLFGPALDAQPSSPVYFLLYFKSGSTELTDESRKIIPDVFQTLKARNSTDVSIIGHTDRVGARETNFKIGLIRANFIKETLVKSGLDPNIVEVFSHGEDNPLIRTEDEIPEPRNRRVEITIR